MAKKYIFKKFVNTGTRLGNYSISISPTYTFGFLTGFYTKEGIKDYKKVVLFFDSENKSIGFQFTNDPNAEGALTLIPGERLINAALTAKNFFLENNIYKKNYFGKKTPRKISDNKFGPLYVIDLEEDK